MRLSRSLITTTLRAHDYRFLSGGQRGIRYSWKPVRTIRSIMLLDLGLPDLDGVEVIHRVRTWSNLPIIVISARSEDTDKIEALDAGADDYLTKPFSVEELLARSAGNPAQAGYPAGRSGERRQLYSPTAG